MFSILSGFSCLGQRRHSQDPSPRDAGLHEQLRRAFTGGYAPSPFASLALFSSDGATMFGRSKMLKRWGVQEALRFQAASRACRDAIQAEPMWLAVSSLASNRRDEDFLLDQWMDGYEKIMEFCYCQDSFELRLELEGIDSHLVREYERHPGLRFGFVHASRMGVVGVVQLGCDRNPDRDFRSVGHVADAPPGVDWTGAPTDFKNQILKCSALRAAVHCCGRRLVVSEVERDAGVGKWPEDMIRQMRRSDSLCTLRIQPLSYCEYALRLQLQIPTTVLAGLVLPHLTPSASIDALSARTGTALLNGSRLRLTGRLWNSEGMSGYPKYFEVRDDAHKNYYNGLVETFDAELTSATVQSCTAVPELNVIFSPEALPASTCLQFDMPYNGGPLDRYDRPDLASLWILGPGGHTCFQLHGLQLNYVAGPDRIVDNHLSQAESCTQAIAWQGRLLVSIDFAAETLKFLCLPPELEDIAMRNSRAQAQLPDIVQALQNMNGPEDQERLLQLLQSITGDPEDGIQLFQQLMAERDEEFEEEEEEEREVDSEVSEQGATSYS